MELWINFENPRVAYFCRDVRYLKLPVLVCASALEISPLSPEEWILFFNNILRIIISVFLLHVMYIKYTSKFYV